MGTHAKRSEIQSDAFAPASSRLYSRLGRLARRANSGAVLWNFSVDSKLIADWVMGRSMCKTVAFQPRLHQLQRVLHKAFGRGKLLPRCMGADWVRYLPREFNTEADVCAPVCVASSHSLVHMWLSSARMVDHLGSGLASTFG